MAVKVDRFLTTFVQMKRLLPNQEIVDLFQSEQWKRVSESHIKGYWFADLISEVTLCPHRQRFLIVLCGQLENDVYFFKGGNETLHPETWQHKARYKIALLKQMPILEIREKPCITKISKRFNALKRCSSAEIKKLKSPYK